MKRLATLIVSGIAALAVTSSSVQAAEPTAAGLWQKTDDGKPVIWVLMVERNGVFEGAIAKTFPKPGENPSMFCTKCEDDRKNAPVLGLSFIRGMKHLGLKYEDGTVLVLGQLAPPLTGETPANAGKYAGTIPPSPLGG